MPPNSIFRAYDIRGIFPQELNYSAGYLIALAFFQTVPGERYLIARDMRIGSQELLPAFSAAAANLGKTLDCLGETTTDMLYFCTAECNYDGAIMLTASHNPGDWAGIKLMGKGLSQVDISQIRSTVERLANVDIPEKAPPTCNFINHTDQYVERLLGMITPEAIGNFKVVIDAGNGMAGKIVEKVFSFLPQVNVEPLYFEPNYRFPHHEANPAIPDNTTDLSRAVLATGADLGIAFDGDADRCFMVDEKGEYIPGHIMAALLAKIVLKRYPGETVIHDFRNVYAIQQEVISSGGTPVAVSAGHTNLKAAMMKYNAVLGIEPSGHFYFRNTHLADNGMLPCLLVLEYLSSMHQSLSHIVSPYREKFFASEEINLVLVENSNIQDIFKRLREQFHHGHITEPDGLVIEFSGWRFNARLSNTESKLRINIEAYSQSQLDRAITQIYELLADFVIEEGEETTSTASLTTTQKFKQVIENMWFTWNPHYILPFVDLYGDGWRRNPPPGGFYSKYGQKRAEEVIERRKWEVQQCWRLMKDYLNTNDNTWFDNWKAKPENSMFMQLSEHPIAYFCLEYGLADWLQIYSGGLGILAGDTIKQASDMGIPLVAVGIFYHQGYFHQDFDSAGNQIETYLAQDPNDYPLAIVKDTDGNQLEISIEIIDHEVWARVWKLQVGRNSLFLLDTNIERNSRPEDRMISAHLYGGDSDTRIRQEILLGIGGPRALRATGILPSIYHMNEGHSGFLVLELARQLIETEGVDFAQAVKLIDDKLVFTNHTLKQAGNDIFNYQLIETYFTTYLDNLHAPLSAVYELGKDQLYAQGNFSMTLLGLRNAAQANAVSQLHGEAAKKLWPDYKLTPITNGVHMPTWVCPEIHNLLDRYVGENWHIPGEPISWEKILDIPDKTLWEAHMQRKQKFIHTLNTELNLGLRLDALTIAWARRFASYKRPDLILSDLEKLAEIVNSAEHPVQIILSGKAHPRDQLGKDLLRQMWQQLQDSKFKNKVVLIPGYNWQLARRAVSGADIWLNTPYRYEEASGTSGMKAAANGVLQFTTLDGWTDEIRWEGMGWVIDENNPATSLYDTLRNEIATTFFQESHGEGSDWTTKMKRTMQMVMERYSSQRMLTEYLDKLYRPLL